jgi:hypothetical protein
LKIIKHTESHIVGLEDGSLWQIYPGDLDLTLGWLPRPKLRNIVGRRHLGNAQRFAHFKPLRNHRLDDQLQRDRGLSNKPLPDIGIR